MRVPGVPFELEPVEMVHVVFPAPFDAEQNSVVVPRDGAVLCALLVSLELREALTRGERFARWLARRLPWWVPLFARWARNRWASILRARYRSGYVGLRFGEYQLGLFPLGMFEPGYNRLDLGMPVHVAKGEELRVQLRGDTTRVGVTVALSGLARRVARS